VVGEWASQPARVGGDEDGGVDSCLFGVAGYVGGNEGEQLDVGAVEGC